MEKTDKLKWIYSARDNKELTERYDQWAKEYDVDLIQDYAWIGPKMAAEFFSHYVSRDARILDAGAGTHLVPPGLGDPKTACPSAAR